MVKFKLGAINQKDNVMGFYIPWDLFQKFFSGEIVDLEIRQMEHWRDLSELNSNIYEEIMADKTIEQAIRSGKWENNSQEWQKLLMKIKPSRPQITLSYKRIYLVASSAAVILLIIGISLALFYEQIKHKNKEIPNGYSYIYSPRGQRTRVVLPDNTKVWLNSESSLRYAANYNQTIREVNLEGEAFFEVKKNPSKPFFVNVNEIKVKVYGTSFNLKAFPKEKYIETTLIEGKLSVIQQKSGNKADHEIYLKPNEKFIYEKTFMEIGATQTKNALSKSGEKQSQLPAREPVKNEPKIIIEKNIDSEPEALWKEGKLIFKNESYGELAVKLERWFDVNIHFEDERIKNYKFTGVFDKETINQAMEALRLSSQKSYKYDIIFRDIYLKS